MKHSRHIARSHENTPTASITSSLYTQTVNPGPPRNRRSFLRSAYHTDPTLRELTGKEEIWVLLDPERQSCHHTGLRM